MSYTKVPLFFGVALVSLMGARSLAAAADSPALALISDVDSAAMASLKYHMAKDYAEFKTIQEVHDFLDKAKLLVQKHPKNVAFASGDLKELLRFLSQEAVGKLIRVDTEPFSTPISDDRLPAAQRAVEEDELVRKLFGGPLRSLVEAKRQQMTRESDGNHKDGNFFTSFWCKISGGCNNNN